MQEPLHDIRKKVANGKRLTAEDGLRLFRTTDILALGELAQTVRTRLHERRVYYSVNLHLNHTNVCATRCDFCFFSRDKNEPDAYAFTVDEMVQKAGEAVLKWDVNEVHIVGGHNPELGLDYFTKLFRRIKRDFPQLYIKALSATEIDDLAKRSGLPAGEVMKALKTAGLDSMPGGGAEIFEPRVRERICPRKITGARWLEIHRTAHKLGISTNATMLYGHIETDADRVDHLLELRKLQDETGGFRAFVPLAFQPAATPGIQPPSQHPVLRGEETSGFLDLKVLSISRLMLDNVPHIKVHWPATGLKFAQAALSFGADDIGGTNLHEKVMRAAGGGTSGESSSSDLVRFIEDAGYEPCLVNSSYQIMSGEPG